MEKKVLIVDDDEGVLLLFSTLLKKDGWTVFMAADGKECFEMIEEAEPDIVLLDFQLPDMDGMEILGKIKQMGLNMPVIMVTASQLEELPKNFLQMGAFDFLSKPIQRSELVFSTAKALNHKILWDRLAEYKEKDYDFGKLKENLEKMAEGDSSVEMGKFILLEKQKSYGLEEFFSHFLSRNQELQQHFSTIHNYIDALDSENSDEVKTASVSLKNLFEDFDVSLNKTVEILEELKIRKEEFENEE